MRRALLVADTVAFAVACVIAGAAAQARLSTIGILLCTFPLWLLGSHVAGLGARDARKASPSTADDVAPIVRLTTAAAFATVIVSWLAGLDGVTTSGVFAFWVAAIVAMLVCRAAARVYARGRTSYSQNVMIVGAGDVGQLVGRKVVQHPEFGMRLVGFVDSEPKIMREDLAGTRVLGGPEDIADIVREHQVDRVVVAFSNDRHDQLVHVVRQLRTLDVHVDLVPRLFEAVGPAVGIDEVEGLPLVSLPSVRPARLAWTCKRVGDVVAAAVLLLATAPLMAWIAWRIRRDSTGPVLFKQTRLGQDMRPFTLLKFRSMTVDAADEPHREYLQQIMSPQALPSNSNLYKLEREGDTTKVGAWLRRTSLDELPQLLNVMRGEMSLVGPRPCIPYETELYEPHHFDRFLVPAGMTGLWQVAARAHATFKEALDLDAAYARNWSLSLDLKLLARTPIVVFRNKGTL
jgi:exopolysaccharide biosynthesis polyprenyl glycosylphosphotransferase